MKIPYNQLNSALFTRMFLFIAIRSASSMDSYRFSLYIIQYNKINARFIATHWMIAYLQSSITRGFYAFL